MKLRHLRHGVGKNRQSGKIPYLAPGLRVPGERWSTFPSVGVPVVRNLTGIQAEPDCRLVTGVGVSFRDHCSGRPVGAGWSALQ